MAPAAPLHVAVALAESAAELLPLSGAGHAYLLDALLGLELREGTTVALVGGTWLAAVIFFRKPLQAALRDGLLGLRHPSGLGQTQGGRDAKAVALATLALWAVAFGVRDHIGAWGRDLTLVGASLLFSAAAVGSTQLAPSGDRDAPTAWGALIVGAVQGVALLPGVSRTGVALASLLWLGVRRERAFELSFLMAIPTGQLALFLVGTPGAQLLPTLALALLVAAFGVGVLALLRAVIVRHLLPLFALYLLPLALATLAWAHARP